MVRLIAAGLISYEKPQLLCELLDEIGRKDLTHLVKDYVQRKNCKLFSKWPLTSNKEEPCIKINQLMLYPFC